MTPRPADTSSTFEETRYLQLARFATVQRNIIITLLLLTFAISALTLVRLYHVSTRKTLSPFIIEIEERTGLTKVLTPAPPERYTTDEIVRNTYITRYITARESYSPTTYNYYYNVVVPALSTGFITSNFYRFIYSTDNSIKNPSPEAKKSLIHLFSQQVVNVKVNKIKSLGEGEHNIPGRAVQVYFTQYPISNDYESQRERIATIGYDFNQSDMSPDVFDVNPLRFRVLYYSLTDVSTEKM